ncbi:uncharacterized protein LOC131853763 [Achroia grisella]|uniref:uncharacterized protein LOC131853763 n=1 Tax=Achroia grisella TaxID=688607 RepID=UPI0027D1EE87|nr:uncharacterized protein LOC131853763 [Achroia grisella]
MLQIPDNVRQDLVRLVPASIINDIACFVYYDNHPRDDNRIDVIICTNSGEIKELYQREIIKEAFFNCKSKPTEIKILRNNACEIYYLVAVDDSVIIFKRSNCLVVHRIVNNVERYDIEDSTCLGQASLKIICKDDAVPMIFDDKFESLGDRALLLSSIHAEETLPIITELNRKLIETKYIVKCNENVHTELLNLRQLTALMMYQKINPNLDESVFKSGSKDMAGAFKIKTCTPWIKMCNKNIIIIFEIINNNEELMENVHILLHSTSRPSLVYTTKLFERINYEPFWLESKMQIVKTNKEFAVVAVIDVKEIKDNDTSRIDISGAMVYKREGKEHILPFDCVSISALDAMGEQFDVLSSHTLDYYAVLSILSTTQKFDLILRYIKADEEPELSMPDTFCAFLGMEQIQNASNVIVHRSSPYHILNSVMVVFPTEKKCIQQYGYDFTVYARSPDQIISLIHFIHDAIPYKIIITTHEHRIIAKTDELAKYNEALFVKDSQKSGYMEYASAMLNQTSLLLEHLDGCMVKMNETKIPEVQQKIGKEIDVLAMGTSNFLELRKNMLEEENRGIGHLRNRAKSVSDSDSEDMAVDLSH